MIRHIRVTAQTKLQEMERLLSMSSECVNELVSQEKLTKQKLITNPGRIANTLPEEFHRGMWIDLLVLVIEREKTKNEVVASV